MLLFLKTLHVAAAVVWLGNFVVTGLWSVRAFAGGSAELRRFAVREILFTDVVFTFTAGAVVVMSGLTLTKMEGIAPWSTVWTRDALEIVIGSALIWLAVLLPLELRMQRLAARDDARALRPSFVWWNVGGWSMTVLLFAVIYLMLAKPT
jgi:uncharacterized membrane protein